MQRSSSRKTILSIIVLALSIAPIAAAQTKYTVTELSLPGSTDSSGTSINNSGLVTGFSDSSKSSGIVHAFVYNGGKITDLGTLPQGTNSDGLGLNVYGDIVGYSETPAGYNVTFMYRSGKMTPIGANIGFSGYSINASDQIAGVSGNHAHLYNHGAMIDLGTLPNDFYSVAYGINDSGQVTGMSHTSTSAITDYHGFIYSRGKLTALGYLPGGNQSYGQAINNHGQVTGAANRSTTLGAPFHVFLYTSGKMTDLGTLAGGSNSVGEGINNLGQVVGYSSNSSAYLHAFLFNGTKMLDLNSLIPANSGWTLYYAYAINDSGQITGQGLYKGVYRGFLLTPVK